MAHYDHGLNRVLAVISETLVELGMELDEINLAYVQVPHFDGIRAQAMDDIVKRIRMSSGVVVACTAQLFAPSAILQTLLEFLECDDYRDALFEKHCLLTMVSKAGGERSALEYLARTICYLDGFESGRIGLQEAHTRNIQKTSGGVRDIIEKTAEDFYRAIRQNRKYIMPADIVHSTGANFAPGAAPVAPASAYTAPTAPHTPQWPVLPAAQAQPPAHLAPPQQQFQQPALPQQQFQQPRPARQPSPPSISLDNFTERQEQDIKELTALFSQKYTPAEETAAPMHPAPYAPAPQHVQQAQPVLRQPPFAANQFHIPPEGYQPSLPPEPQVRTLKQLTQNLPHYYQPQMAAGLTAVIQFLITGAESFEGYMTIVDNECEYTDGQAENPEITIISDSSTWSDVLKGKHTAQKAFMIGGLKVRGNFVLLTKFDSLFKL